MHVISDWDENLNIDHDRFLTVPINMSLQSDWAALLFLITFLRTSDIMHDVRWESVSEPGCTD